MKNILIIGAGKSSISLINYLAQEGLNQNWTITIADKYLEAAEKKAIWQNTKAIALDTDDASTLNALIANKALVISLAPPDQHLNIAKVCLKHNVSLFTASYVSEQMLALNNEVLNKNLLFLNEMGCDPGIDHMSAMAIIDHIHEQNGVITSFKSYTGGLIAPEADNNPWHYKFSWNPRNVILAGAGTPARYLNKNQIKFIPYHRLFKTAEIVQVPSFGPLEAYANRDSIPYAQLYSLPKIETLLRATFRYPDFTLGWAVLVELGLTNDNLQLSFRSNATGADFLMSFMPSINNKYEIKQYLYNFIENEFNQPLKKEQIWNQLTFLGLTDHTPLPITKGTAAQILQSLAEPKLKLHQQDTDLVVMHHSFEYTIGLKKFETSSSLVLKGKNNEETAMAATVGLPLAIAASLFLNGNLSLKGVCIPIQKEIYKPVLDKLTHFGVVFQEHTKEIGE